MMHAALDRLEELLGPGKVFDLVKMQRGTKWLGSLLPMEDYEIYGHVTTSGIKILVLIQRESVIPFSKRKDTNVRVLCVSCYFHDFLKRKRKCLLKKKMNSGFYGRLFSLTYANPSTFLLRKMCGFYYSRTSMRHMYDIL